MANANPSIVKLLYIANQGPVLAILQSETNDSLIVSHPAQLGQDENGDIQIVSYLDGIIDDSKHVTFMKYNITSVADPAEALGAAYVEAVEELTKPESGIIMPAEKKIIHQ